MRRPDERADTILQSPLPPGSPPAHGEHAGPPDTEDDRTLPDRDAGHASDPSPADDDNRTQFVDASRFLENVGDSSGRSGNDLETVRTTEPLPGRPQDSEPQPKSQHSDSTPDPTIDSRLDTAARSADREEDTHTDHSESGAPTVVHRGSDFGGDTTFIGAPGGPTILASPPGSGRPGFPPGPREPRTMRPATSRTIAERDGSATLAQAGGKSSAGRPAADATHYEFIQEIAQGGMGRIWRASDLRIRRDVAFKELLPDALREPEALERFIEEAQVTGQLEHPGIVPVYELGRQENGTPFYSMKLVGGSTLRDAIQEYHALPADSGERRLAFVKLLRNLVAVCNAIGFAHERGVLHRDLKPLNIMLGDFGETLVLDWGMAKVLGDASGEAPPDTTEAGTDGGQARAAESGDSTRTELELSQPSVAASRSVHSQTRSGQSSRRHSVKTDARSAGTETQMGSIMGTPNYMAPEQALGHIDEFDARTDIYSLGAILYEILTSRPPVPKGKITEKLKYIIEGRTPPPRQVDATIPRPLEAICLKAMARLKDERYQTAMELAADIEAYLADEPVSVYADPWSTRVRRWAKRHRTAVMTTAAAAFVAIAAWLAWNVVENRRMADVEEFVREQMAAAREALGRNEFDDAADRLNAANLRLANFPVLSALQSGVESQQSTVRQLRRDYAERQVRDQLAAAELAMAESDFVAAGTALTEAAAIVSRQTDLRELQPEVSRRQAELKMAVEAQRRHDQVQQDFARFTELADRARMYGSLLRGENPQQDAAAAREAALEGLAVFESQGAEPLQNLPAELDESQIAALRHGGYELSYMLAQLELTLAWDADGDERQRVGERALRWIEQAKAFGLQTRALLARQGGILEWLGRDNEAAQVWAVYEETMPTSALDYFLLGEQSRTQGDYAAALAHYERAMQIEPDYFWAMYFAGLCHLQRGDLQAAVSSYTACIALQPDFPWNYPPRGLAWGLLGRSAEAESDFEQSLASTHPLADTYFRMGTYLNRGSVRLVRAVNDDNAELVDQAIADFTEAARLIPDRADPHLNMAHAYRWQAERTAREEGALAAAPIFERALKEATAAAGRAPITAAAYILRGTIHWQVGDTRQAVGDFQRATEVASSDRDRARAHLELGRIYYAARDYQTALVNFDSAIENDPGSAEAYFLRAEAQRELRRHREAAADFVKFIELAESEHRPTGLIDVTPQAWQSMLAKAYRWRGELAVLTGGDYRQALPDYIRSAERNPDSPELLTRRGWAYAEKGFELAEADFTDAIESNRKANRIDADPWNGRGYARVMLGRYEEAVQDAEHAIELARKQVGEGEVLGWGLLFNPACIFAQAVDRAEEDRALAAEERTGKADQFAARAIELLKEAEQAAGPAGRAGFLRTVRGERALNPIRDRAEFPESWQAESSAR